MTNRRILRNSIAGVILLSAGAIGGMRAFNRLSSPPEDLGVIDGRLWAYSDSPNCVSSQAPTGDSHYIEPLKIKFDEYFLGGKRPRLPDEIHTYTHAIEKLAKIADGLPRSTICRISDDYLHVEFRSLVFGFVDDAEFVVDANDDTIHLRSASRFGYSDFGVNRKRIERIRQIWANDP